MELEQVRLTGVWDNRNEGAGGEHLVESLTLCGSSGELILGLYGVPLSRVIAVTCLVGRLPISGAPGSLASVDFLGKGIQVLRIVVELTSLLVGPR